MREEERATGLTAEIRGGADSCAIMEREFVARRLAALPHGPLEVVRRAELPPAHAEAVFAAAAGDVVGPLEGEGVFDLVRAVRLATADLSDVATRNAVSDAVFDAWLAEERRAANIEWFWGPVAV
ncbi:MAG: hypothetical protein ABIT20_06580 [Gemmatimonadaceae bacterium]